MSLKNSEHEQIPEPAEMLRCYYIRYYFDGSVFYLFYLFYCNKSIRVAVWAYSHSVYIILVQGVLHI